MQLPMLFSVLWEVLIKGGVLDMMPVQTSNTSVFSWIVGRVLGQWALVGWVPLAAMAIMVGSKHVGTSM